MGGSLTERALAIGFAKIRTRPAQPQGDEKRLLKAAEELRLGRLGAAAANIAALEVRKPLGPSLASAGLCRVLTVTVLWLGLG